MTQATNRFYSLALAAATVWGVFAPVAHAVAPTSFYVPINRSELVTSNSDISEVIVADPEIANVVVHGKRQVSVLGVAVGQTTMRAFDGSHRLVFAKDIIVTYDLPALRRALKEFLPAERVGVSMVNNRIALTGEVSGADVAKNALEIAEEFVRGKVSDKEAASRKVNDGDKNDTPIINLMKISSGQQVMLRIRIGEVQRTAVKNLGVSLQAAGDKPVLALGTGAGRLVDSGSTSSFVYKKLQASTDAFLTGGLWSNGSSGLGIGLEALERDGLLKTLAEPTLTALSGEQAEFLAGGEFPLVIPASLGQPATVQYKSFGVALKFIPYVLSKNRIRIQVQPEVSELSTDNSVSVGGTSVPSIVTRRASTTVELAPGESFMLAGLLRDNATSTIDQLPGAGEIPVLGALFRSTKFQRNETELVIAVTPYIVDPVKDSDIKLPTDDFRPPSFFESVFYGAVASNKGAKGGSLEGPTGFMTDN